MRVMKYNETNKAKDKTSNARLSDKTSCAYGKVNAKQKNTLPLALYTNYGQKVVPVKKAGELLYNEGMNLGQSTTFNLPLDEGPNRRRHTVIFISTIIFCFSKLVRNRKYFPRSLRPNYRKVHISGQLGGLG